MKEKRANQNTKYGEATKVIRLPESLANFLQQYPSAINELVSQIKDGELDLTISVTACNSVTDIQAYDIQSMIDDALRSKILELREEFIEHEAIAKSESQKCFEAQIATFRTEYDEMIETKIAAALEATESAKKPLLSVMRAQVAA